MRTLLPKSLIVLLAASTLLSCSPKPSLDSGFGAKANSIVTVRQRHNPNLEKKKEYDHAQALRDARANCQELGFAGARPLEDTLKRTCSDQKMVFAVVASVPVCTETTIEKQFQCTGGSRDTPMNKPADRWLQPSK
ncbi:MAG: YecR-like lipofamily protein [Desulfovibrio sp.]|jgi:hypothetical protein|nr:YecR-like lipofamily protein [Desulfovibrio sp.]